MGLARYTVRRFLQTIPVLIGVATITFFLTKAIPGGPIEVMLGPSPAQAQKEALRREFGLTKPIWMQYLIYIGNASPIWVHPTGSFPYFAFEFGIDLGTSIYYEMPVTKKIMQRLPATLLLLASSFTFTLVTAIPLGVISAARRNEPADHASRGISLIGVSTPDFWIGLMLIIAFSFYGINIETPTFDLLIYRFNDIHFQLPATGLVMPWADPAGVENASTRIDVLVASARHLIMPTITLGTFQMAAATRIERSSMLENLGTDYVRLARAYGVKESTILRKHAFRPAQLPVITILGLNLTAALGGAVLTETVFSINGMGRLIITAINNRDYPLVMGTTLYFGFVFVVGVILTDISYAYIDPRVSYGEEEP